MKAPEAEGPWCDGMQLLLDQGYLRTTPIYSLAQGCKTHDIIHFKASKGMSNGLCPNYCPMCGKLVYNGVPTCGKGDKP